MATVASMIYQIEAQTASIEKSMKDVAGFVDNAEKSMISSIATGVAFGEMFERLGEQILHDAVALVEWGADITMHGAVVGEVGTAYERLTSQAGLLSDALLTTLRAATHGTIDDFDLMKRVNQDLAAGMNLTDAQFGLLAQGAFALAKATGGDVKTAMDSMNDAMMTGRVRSLALLTGKIDLKSAEEAFATSLGGTAEHLTAEGKIEADRVAILHSVGAAVERLGEQTVNLDDKVQQGKVAWTNFEDELGRTIADSPVIAAAFDSMKQALSVAFGPDQKAQIAGIASVVDSLAIHVVDMGLATVEAGRVVHTGWSVIETAVDGVALSIVGIVTAIGEVLLAADRMAGKLHLVDPEEVEKIRQTQQYLRDLTGDIAHNTAEAALGTVGMSKFDETLDKAGGSLFVMRDNMIAATEAQKHQTVAVAGFVGPLQQVNDGEKKHGDYLKENEEATLELRKVTDEYYKAVNAASHDTVQRQIDDAYLAATTRIAQMEKTKTYTIEAEMLIWAAADQTASNIIQKTLESDKYTKEHYRLIADEAKIAYDFALDHLTSFTNQEIQLRHAAYVAAERDSNHWSAAASSDMDQVAAASDRTVEAMNRIADAEKKVADEAAKAYAAMMAMGGSITYDLSTQAGMEYYKRMNPAALVNASPEYFKTHTLQQAEDAGLVNPYAGYAGTGSTGAGYAGGVQNAPGGWAMVGERGPEPMYVPPGANIYPSGSKVGGDTYVTVNLSGAVATDRAQFKRVVSNVFMEVARQNRLLPS